MKPQHTGTNYFSYNGFIYSFKVSGILYWSYLSLPLTKSLLFPISSPHWLHILYCFSSWCSWIQLMLLSWAWVWKHQPRNGQFTSMNFPRWEWASLPNQPSTINSLSTKGGKDFMNPSLVHVGILTDLLLLKSCSCNHGCYEFMRAISISSSEVRVSQLPSHLLAPTYSFLLTLLLWCSLSLEWGKLT